MHSTHNSHRTEPGKPALGSAYVACSMLACTPMLLGALRSSSCRPCVDGGACMHAGGGISLVCVLIFTVCVRERT